jgi:hypothetical protein
MKTNWLSDVGKEYPALLISENGQYSVALYPTEEEQEADLRNWFDRESELAPGQYPPLPTKAMFLGNGKVRVIFSENDHLDIEHGQPVAAMSAF